MDELYNLLVPFMCLASFYAINNGNRTKRKKSLIERDFIEDENGDFFLENLSFSDQIDKININKLSLEDLLDEIFFSDSQLDVNLDTLDIETDIKGELSEKIVQKKVAEKVLPLILTKILPKVRVNCKKLNVYGKDDKWESYETVINADFQNNNVLIKGEDASDFPIFHPTNRDNSNECGESFFSENCRKVSLETRFDCLFEVNEKIRNESFTDTIEVLSLVPDPVKATGNIILTDPSIHSPLLENLSEQSISEKTDSSSVEINISDFILPDRRELLKVSESFSEDFYEKHPWSDYDIMYPKPVKAYDISQRLTLSDIGDEVLISIGGEFSYDAYISVNEFSLSYPTITSQTYSNASVVTSIVPLDSSHSLHSNYKNARSENSYGESDNLVLNIAEDNYSYIGDEFLAKGDVGDPNMDQSQLISDKHLNSNLKNLDILSEEDSRSHEDLKLQTSKFVFFKIAGDDQTRELFAFSDSNVTVDTNTFRTSHSPYFDREHIQLYIGEQFDFEVFDNEFELFNPEHDKCNFVCETQTDEILTQRNYSMLALIISDSASFTLYDENVSLNLCDERMFVETLPHDMKFAFTNDYFIIKDAGDEVQHENEEVNNLLSSKEVACFCIADEHAHEILQSGVSLSIGDLLYFDTRVNSLAVPEEVQFNPTLAGGIGDDLSVVHRTEDVLLKNKDSHIEHSGLEVYHDEIDIYPISDNCENLFSDDGMRKIHVDNKPIVYYEGTSVKNTCSIVQHDGITLHCRKEELEIGKQVVSYQIEEINIMASNLAVGIEDNFNENHGDLAMHQGEEFQKVVVDVIEDTERKVRDREEKSILLRDVEDNDTVLGTLENNNREELRMSQDLIIQQVKGTSETVFSTRHDDMALEDEKAELEIDYKSIMNQNDEASEKTDAVIKRDDASLEDSNIELDIDYEAIMRQGEGTDETISGAHRSDNNSLESSKSELEIHYESLMYQGEEFNGSTFGLTNDDETLSDDSLKKISGNKYHTYLQGEELNDRLTGDELNTQKNIIKIDLDDELHRYREIDNIKIEYKEAEGENNLEIDEMITPYRQEHVSDIFLRYGVSGKSNNYEINDIYQREDIENYDQDIQTNDIIQDNIFEEDNIDPRSRLLVTGYELNENNIIFEREGYENLNIEYLNSEYINNMIDETRIHNYVNKETITDLTDFDQIFSSIREEHNDKYGINENNVIYERDGTENNMTEYLGKQSIKYFVTNDNFYSSPDIKTDNQLEINQNIVIYQQDYTNNIIFDTIEHDEIGNLTNQNDFLDSELQEVQSNFVITENSVIFQREQTINVGSKFTQNYRDDRFEIDKFTVIYQHDQTDGTLVGYESDDEGLYVDNIKQSIYKMVKHDDVFLRVNRGSIELDYQSLLYHAIDQDKALVDISENYSFNNVELDYHSLIYQSSDINESVFNIIECDNIYLTDIKRKLEIESGSLIYQRQEINESLFDITDSGATPESDLCTFAKSSLYLSEPYLFDSFITAFSDEVNYKPELFTHVIYDISIPNNKISLHTSEYYVFDAFRPPNYVYKNFEIDIEPDYILPFVLSPTVSVASNNYENYFSHSLNLVIDEFEYNSLIDTMKTISATSDDRLSINNELHSIEIYEDIREEEDNIREEEDNIRDDINDLDFVHDKYQNDYNIVTMNIVDNLSNNFRDYFTLSPLYSYCPNDNGEYEEYREELEKDIIELRIENEIYPIVPNRFTNNLTQSSVPYSLDIFSNNNGEEFMSKSYPILTIGGMIDYWFEAKVNSEICLVQNLVIPIFIPVLSVSSPLIHSVYSSKDVSLLIVRSHIFSFEENLDYSLSGDVSSNSPLMSGFYEFGINAHGPGINPKMITSSISSKSLGLDRSFEFEVLMSDVSLNDLNRKMLDLSVPLSTFIESQSAVGNSPYSFSSSNHTIISLDGVYNSDEMNSKVSNIKSDSHSDYSILVNETNNYRDTIQFRKDNGQALSLSPIVESWTDNSICDRKGEGKMELVMGCIANRPPIMLAGQNTIAEIDNYLSYDENNYPKRSLVTSNSLVNNTLHLTNSLHIVSDESRQNRENENISVPEPLVNQNYAFTLDTVHLFSRKDYSIARSYPQLTRFYCDHFTIESSACLVGQSLPDTKSNYLSNSFRNDMDQAKFVNVSEVVISCCPSNKVGYIPASILKSHSQSINISYEEQSADTIELAYEKQMMICNNLESEKAKLEVEHECLTRRFSLFMDSVDETIKNLTKAIKKLSLEKSKLEEQNYILRNQFGEYKKLSASRLERIVNSHLNNEYNPTIDISESYVLDLSSSSHLSLTRNERDSVSIIPDDRMLCETSRSPKSSAQSLSMCSTASLNLIHPSVHLMKSGNIVSVSQAPSSQKLILSIGGEHIRSFLQPPPNLTFSFRHFKVSSPGLTNIHMQSLPPIAHIAPHDILLNDCSLDYHSKDIIIPNLVSLISTNVIVFEKYCTHPALSTTFPISIEKAYGKLSHKSKCKSSQTLVKHPNVLIYNQKSYLHFSKPHTVNHYSNYNTESEKDKYIEILKQRINTLNSELDSQLCRQEELISELSDVKATYLSLLRM